MKEIDKYKEIWEKLVNELYEQDEEFNYIKVKKLNKSIKVFYNKIEKKIEEIKITLDLTEFNDKIEVEEELTDLLDYLQEMEKYLQNFIKYEPKTKKGYYNYLKDIIPFL